MTAREPAAERSRRRETSTSRTEREAAGDDPAAAADPELSELEEARRQADEYLADLRRVAADFDNFRKRVARDAEDQARRAIEGIMGELLPVLDNLERALEASEHHEEAKVAEGVSLVASSWPR